MASSCSDSMTIAILAALALPDVDDHAGAVDVVDRERDGLGDAQAGGVDRW